jgi:hypothetical protein
MYGSLALLARRLGQFEGPASATEVKHARCNGFTTRWRRRTRARPFRSHYRSIERDESLIRQWLEKEYPKILAMVKIQGMDIYFGDAARIRSWRHRHRHAARRSAMFR